MATTTQAGQLKNNNELFAGSEGSYLLPHHVKEIERLKTQQGLILSSTGNVLLTTPLKAKLRILDSGAADGTWLTDVARLYPSTEWSLHGADIGSALFPPKTESYPALDLHELDIRGTIPPSLKWESSFDIIHQRLLVWGLQSEDWPKVLQNHLSLLKPGGWIQLVEAEWIHEGYDATKLPNLAKITKVQKWCGSQFNMDMSLVYRLESLLKSAGFDNVSTTFYSLGYGSQANDVAWKERSVKLWVDSFRGFAAKWPEEGIPEVAKTVQEYNDMLEGLHHELLEHGCAPKLHYVIAQKPE